MDPAVITCPVYRNSQNHPDRMAVRSDKTSLTYAELERLIQGFAGKLKAAGMKTGDRIGVIAGNSVAYAALIFAACRTGVTLVSINTRLNPDDWIDCIKRSACKLLFIDAKRTAFARSSGYDSIVLDGDESDDGGSIATGRDSSISGEVSPDQEASVVFTSGSGGTPKGVILTFGNHYYNALASNENIPLGFDDCWLAVLPFYHVGGMSILFRAAIAGCSAYVMNGFDTDRINRLIDEGIVTHISLVPIMLSLLLTVRQNRRLPDTLRAILLGGGSVSGRLIDDIEKLSLPVLTTYGMTETASQVCTLAPDDSVNKLCSSGKPLGNAEVRIVDAEGQQACENGDGEIVVRGKTVFKGYLGEDSEATFDPDGWFRTGDIGCFDEDGYLRVKGRMDSMFISGGENIYPSAIERAASEFSGVAECVVIAVDDARWGKRPVLFVTRMGDSDLVTHELRSFLEARLSRIQQPDRIIEIGQFPRTSINKIDGEKLKEMFFKDFDSQGDS